jgi:hypothetical protein
MTKRLIFRRHWCEFGETQKYDSVHKNWSNILRLANQKNDFRVLEHIINGILRNYAHQSISSDRVLSSLRLLEIVCQAPSAPITAGLAYFEEDVQKQLDLYDRALIQYKEVKRSAPFETWRLILLKKFQSLSTYCQDNKLYFSHVDRCRFKLDKDFQQISNYFMQMTEILQENEKDPSFSTHENTQRFVSNCLFVVKLKIHLETIRSTYKMNFYYTKAEEENYQVYRQGKFDSSFEPLLTKNDFINRLRRAGIDKVLNQALVYLNEFTIENMIQAARLKERIFLFKETNNICKLIDSKFPKVIKKNKYLKSEINEIKQRLKSYLDYL